jgi:hypothetical protein
MALITNWSKSKYTLRSLEIKLLGFKWSATTAATADFAGAGAGAGLAGAATTALPETSPVSASLVELQAARVRTAIAIAIRVRCVVDIVIRTQRIKTQ